MYGTNRSSANFPIGFRFHPTDEELIIHYLKQKVEPSINQQIYHIIADVNIYKFNPWELPDKAFFGESEWFFFSPRERKYPNGTRPNRAAACGYWKSTGTDKPIIASFGTSQCLGMKKSLVFYKGRPLKAVKTDWMMIEYRLLDDYHRPKGFMRLDDWVLCRVSQKGKATKQREGRRCDSMSSSCSPSLPNGYLQGQDVVTENTINRGNEYRLPTEYQMFPLEREELNTSSTQTTIDYNVREVLNSIERVLSVGALDELYLSASTSSSNGHTSVFQ